MLKKIYKIVVSGRLKEISVLVKNKRYKQRSAQEKYKRWRKKREGDIPNEICNRRSCIAFVILVSEDSSLLELEHTLESIYKQSQYKPAGILLVAHNRSKLEEDLREKMERLCKEEGILYSTGIDSVRDYEYHAYIQCGDILAINFLKELEFAIRQKFEFIYSDEDQIIRQSGVRSNPFFKPGWSPDTLLDFNYIGNSFICSRELFLKANCDKKKNSNPNDELLNSKIGCIIWLYDYILRVTEHAAKIKHIPKVLYHSALQDINLQYSRLLQNEFLTSEFRIDPELQKLIYTIKQSHLQRVGKKGTIVESKKSRLGHIQYELPQEVFVSIIILTKDNYDVFVRCVNSILDQTCQIPFEIIVVDNGSDQNSYETYKEYSKLHNLHYFHQKMPFNFSYMCNYGAMHAKGNVLVFLNDDTQVITRNWLSIMCGQAMQDNTALVGAKLLYPEINKIQHCGIINLKGNPAHAFYQMKDETDHYHNLSNAVMNCIAVTGACMMVEKKKFDFLGGWDERFPVAYNDIDFSMRAVKAGYFNVVRNDVVLYHYESVSRGTDFTYRKIRRLAREQRRLYTLNEEFFGKDPFYNPNLNPFSIDYDIDYL
ncbi:MAG: glycosyltransferase [Clostridiales bacterium]|nr:glycosyltransferase [Clostridiales bacterium]